MFAINPFIGEGLKGTGDFATAKDLLDHLDYLEIDRSLVSSQASCDTSAIGGNRELLEMIAPYRDRLYPCFVVTPADYWEIGNMDFLQQQLAAGNRAFYLCYRECEYHIRDVERIIGELAPGNPVFFLACDYHTPHDVYREVAEIADKYPQVTFVCTKQMWGNFQSTLDLMWRCRNVLLDISWLHMRDTLEMVAEKFGAERMVFGIGGKSHYGAAVAILAHSRLTAEQKELIAHGNLERILGIKPLTKQLWRESPLKAQKPVWNLFRQGKSMAAAVPGQVVDCHAHAGAFNGGWCVPGNSATMPEFFRSFVEFMDRHGVGRIIDATPNGLMGNSLKWNRAAEKLGTQYPNRFSGWFCINPNYATQLNEAQLDEDFARGYFSGFKILPSYQEIPITDSAYDLVWNYADKHRLPVLSHTWGDKYDAPHLFREIVKKYTNMKLIIGHSGGSELQDRLDAEALVMDFPNVYMDSCATFCCQRPWYLAIQKCGNTRFTLGTDSGCHNQAFELGVVLSQPIPDTEIMPILGENWRRIQADRI